MVCDLPDYTPDLGPMTVHLDLIAAIRSAGQDNVPTDADIQRISAQVSLSIVMYQLTRTQYMILPTSERQNVEVQQPAARENLVLRTWLQFSACESRPCNTRVKL